jgi:hypothetical protein
MCAGGCANSGSNKSNGGQITLSRLVSSLNENSYGTNPSTYNRDDIDIGFQPVSGGLGDAKKIVNNPNGPGVPGLDKPTNIDIEAKKAADKLNEKSRKASKQYQNKIGRSE